MNLQIEITFYSNEPWQAFAYLFQQLKTAAN